MEGGFYPFWFWNGPLDADEIRWQVREMAAQGVRGFYIHSRQGLRVPYLSDAFLDLVGVAVDAAVQHGMTVHLYDEYPYPSGAAGGRVTLGNPHFHATELIQQSRDVAGGAIRLELPAGKLLWCCAYPLRDGVVAWEQGIDLRGAVGTVLGEESYVLMGLTRYNRKRYFASDPLPVLETVLPEGAYRICMAVQAVVEHHKYWGKFIDVLNPDAVQCFLSETHERYFRRFGATFGRTIRSIFTDETAAGWSERLPTAFLEAYGYDLLPLLPALQDPAHPDALRVRHDLDRLKYRLFCQSFEEPIASWCRQHGLLYGGEKPSQRLAQLRYMDIPGCEPGHTKAGAPPDLLQPDIRGNARATASAAYFYGKEGALCECYHSLGWGATLLDARLIADGLLLMGIRYLVPHGFFASTHALAKHDAPPTFFFQAPYWRLFGCLSARVERIAAAFADTHIDAEILVVDPASGLPTREDKEAYQRLLEGLMRRHLDFLIVDTDILESGTIGSGAVRIREIAATVVILPPMAFIEEPLQAWLTAFERAGGLVIRVARACDEEALDTQVRARIRAGLRLTAIRGDASRITMVSRTGGGRRLWFLVNTGGTGAEADFAAGAPLHELPLDAGPARGLVARADGTYRRAIQPFESLLLAEDPAAAPQAVVPRFDVPIRGALAFRPLNRNLLRMDTWEMALGTPDGWGPTAPVSAVPLVHQLESGRFTFAPAMRHHFGQAPELRLPRLQVRYCAAFENAQTGAVELVMEPGSIAGAWTLRVNDGPAIGQALLRPSTAHVRGSLGIDITAWLRSGRNTLTLEVETDQASGGLRNPLYLAGDFGVQLASPVRLAARPATGRFHDLDADGLPHYAGEVEYDCPFTLAELPHAERVGIVPDFGKPFEDACELAVNDGAWQAAPWPPYEVVVGRDELRAGTNILRIRVLTSLLRAFEGQTFDIGTHAYRDVGASS